tara:strand:+ start:9762 stop:11732 length:1971 start_codon:yes stop_codon:yes gene_type:complete
MAALTEEVYGTIADIEGGVSSDKKDIGNYVKQGKHYGKKYFVGTRYGVTFDFWLEQNYPEEAKDVFKSGNLDKLIKQFENTIKSSNDAKDVFEEAFFTNPKGNNISLKGIENPATSAFVLDAMVNQNFSFNNTDSNNIYEAIKKAGGTNTGDIVKDINSVNQAEFRKSFLDVRVDRYSKSKTSKDHMKGWMKRLDDLSDTWADKGESSLLNPDFNFQDNIRGKEGKYKYINQEALEDSEKMKTVVPPGMDKMNIIGSTLEEKAELEEGREEEKAELLERDAKALGLEESINKGLNKIGSGQLSPEFVRGVQEGTENIYDEDVKNAFMAMDPDNPLEIYEGKEIYTDSVGNLTVVMPGMDKSGLQPITLEEVKSKVQMGPELVEGDDTFVYDDPLKDDEGIVDEDEDVTILKGGDGSEDDKKGGTTGEDEDKKPFPWLTVAGGALAALAAAKGQKHIKEAMVDIPVEEQAGLDSAWKAYMARMKEASESGLSAQERTAAMDGLSEAYNLGVKNVMRASGGSRASFLANAGVLNANRVKGLLKLNAMDAAAQRDSLNQYGQALKYQQEHGRMTGEFDRRMAYNEEKRKSDLHGQLGNTLMQTAIQEVSRGLTNLSNKGNMEVYEKMLDSKLTNSALTNFYNTEKSNYTSLTDNLNDED